jgi:hypothetical protein
LKTFETLVNIRFAAVLLKFGKSEVSFDLISKSRIFKKWFLKNLMGKEKFNAEIKKIGSCQKRKKSVRFFFQPGRRF